MRHTRDKITEDLAERRCWGVAHRDDSRVARRLYRQQELDGVDRRDEGAVLDDFCHVLQAVGVMALLEQSQGAAIQREMIACAQDCPALWGEDPVGHRTHEGLAQLAVQ